MFQKVFHTLRPVMAAGFVLIAVASSAFAQDVLRPEEAFRYQTEIRGDEVLVRWIIEPEHYLYRDRMGVSGLTPGIELGEAVFPQGELHADEFFGEMEIYRDEAVVRIPFERSEDAPDELELELRLQGCADFGLCYPPQKWTTTLPLASSEPSRASLQDTGDLREWLNSTSICGPRGGWSISARSTRSWPTTAAFCAGTISGGNRKADSSVTRWKSTEILISP